jgi:predicted PurR-regulated permease PerM
MVAVLVFGSLLGFVGLFLAVPLGALVKMIVVRLMKQYQSSPIYSSLPGGEAPGI